jgi:hypothetical protein
LPAIYETFFATYAVSLEQIGVDAPRRSAVTGRPAGLSAFDEAGY